MPSLRVVFAAALCAGSLHGAVNLTPESSFRELEGARFPQLLFTDGSRKIAYEVPRAWEYFPQDPKKIVLRPASHVQADATIEEIDSPVPLKFDGLGFTVMTAAVRTLIPVTAEQVVIGEPIANPLRMGNRDTCEMQASFAQFGQKFMLSVLFLPLDKSYLRYSLSCRAVDYPQLHRKFYGSLHTWQWLDPLDVP